MKQQLSSYGIIQLYITLLQKYLGGKGFDDINPAEET